MQLSPEQQAAIEEQKKYCPFCKIAKGDIPAQKLYEDEDFIAILDINPGVAGHTLLVPKEHYPILPLMPPEKQARLATVQGQLSRALKKSMVNLSCDIFIANGAAAGQQTSHFLVHLLPNDSSPFSLPPGQHKAATELLRKKFGVKDARTQLVEMIQAYPELRRMIIEQPDELIKNLPGAPDLQRVFHGVDIHVLSQRLREQDRAQQAPPAAPPSPSPVAALPAPTAPPPPPAETQPSAATMTDAELIAFINGKEKLRDLLVDDPATLEEVSAHQDKLRTFFAGTTVPAVRERYLRGGGHV